MNSEQLTELQLLVIYTPDLERTKSFYEILGLKFSAERHGSGPLHFAANVAGVVFEIYPSHDNEVSQSARLGFRVLGISRVVDEFRSAGFRIISEPSSSPWGIRAVIQDPDNRKVEITELSS